MLRVNISSFGGIIGHVEIVGIIKFLDFGHLLFHCLSRVGDN